MSVQSVLEVLLARIESKPLEIHASGQWRAFYGTDREIIEAMQSGTLFRVKRVPRTLWAEQDGGRRLTGVCWTDEKDAIAEIGGAYTLVEFREVMQ